MGWNSTQRHGLRDEVYHVSIPNGIEFYLVACFSLRLSFIVSIPNGMEFYQILQGEACAVSVRFNSQRDGILRYGNGNCIVDHWFQFPTGWNSTLTLSVTPSLVIISIPNGMEFYDRSFIKGLDPKNCFNSQRDGIILSPGPSASSYTDCFNSQRDGILLKGSRIH